MATISANGDEKIGDLMADAMEKVGKEGVITVDEGKSTESVLEYTEGMQFDKGYLSPYFLTNPTTLEAVLENAYILLHEKKIANLAELLPLLNKVVAGGRPLLIIAEDVEAEALAALVVNKLRGVLNICAVKAPGFGDRRKAMMGDLAVVTGGKFISEDLGLKLENVELDRPGLGQAYRHRQGQHADRRRRRARRRRSMRGPSRFASRSRRRPAITIAKNSRNAWRN